MKRNRIIFVIIALILCGYLLSGCATLASGPLKKPATDYQKTKPKPGEARREIRVVPFIVDLLFWPPLLAVDFWTHKIYRPEPKKEKVETE